MDWKKGTDNHHVHLIYHLDYFLWGYLKGKVYATKPRNLEKLRQRIIEEAALIAPEFLRNALASFYDRIAHCQTVNGAQFEHLI